MNSVCLHVLYLLLVNRSISVNAPAIPKHKNEITNKLPFHAINPDIRATQPAIK